MVAFYVKDRVQQPVTVQLPPNLLSKKGRNPCFPKESLCCGSSFSVFKNTLTAWSQMSLEMCFLPENQWDQQHKETAYGKVLAPGGMQIGLYTTFFMIYDSSHGSKLDLGERRFWTEILEQRVFWKITIFFQEINIASPSIYLWSPWLECRIKSYLLETVK